LVRHQHCKNRDNEFKKIANEFLCGNNLVDQGCADGRYKISLKISIIKA